MILIIYATTTKTEWCILDKSGIVDQAISDGINPLFQTRIEISRIIRLQLPQSFFTTKLTHIFFYGAGCHFEKMKNSIKSPLETQLKAQAYIKNDMEGVVHALFPKGPGIACILDSESRACSFDGEKIIRDIQSTGFILGDQGSSVSLGKKFLADCLQGLAPADITELFYQRNKINPEEIIEYIYTRPLPNKLLSVISYFLYENIDNEYVGEIIYNDMRTFLERNVLQFRDHENYPIRCVGPIAKIYSSYLKKAALSLGIFIDHIIESPMKGLIKYHQGKL